MRNMSDTIARLSNFRGLSVVEQDARKSRLKDMVDFGSNPGALRARVHVPAGLPAKAPLVVALHGCTQTGGAYDRGSGWSDLADVQEFAVLYPEQLRSNNMNRCFNWFVPDDIKRVGGEAQSIREMVAKLVADHDLDPDRIFVTGLSAGGAMTAVMLATYPDVFAGGAVIAGIPYGAAQTMSSAFDRMRGSGKFRPDELGELVKGASDHQGPWPTLSIWHGDSDKTVDHSNAGLLIDQWRALHDLQAEPDITETVDGHPRRVWNDADGRPVIEDFRIAGMGHGTPLDAASDAGGGTSGPYMLDVGIASTRHIAAFWGLCDSSKEAKPGKLKVEPVAEKRVRAAPNSIAPVADGVAGVINDALRSAGLLR